MLFWKDSKLPTQR